MRFDVITLFPDMVTAAASVGVTGKALERGITSLSVWNPRDYTHDKHKTVDDRPYGGGPGMVMKYQPLHDAVSAAKKAGYETTKVVYLSPQGKPITQALLSEIKHESQLILVTALREVMAFCESVQDYNTREILQVMLKDTEDDHTHWLEKQLGLIERIGLQNYLQSQI